MKRLQAMGIGNKKKQAEILTVEHEEILWSKGLLGDHTPQSLLDTIVYCNGLFFALRSGREHQQLRSSPCQIEVVERSGKRPYLKYTEDISKNHPGGLKGRHAKPKVVSHHANISEPKRCFVRLFKLYRQLCPTDVPLDTFYLQPAKKPTSTCWYSKVPLGHTKLSSTVSRLCKMAGIEGYFTNHSLRATATSRLYHAGVDEQLVMERTGHRSIEGAQSYKRTSDEQREALSDLLNRQVTVPGPSNAVSTEAQLPSKQPDQLAAISNLVSSIQTSQLRSVSLPSATFNNCTVNFYVGSGCSCDGGEPKRKRRVLVLDSDDSD